MSRLTITMRDPLADRLAVAANVTGLHPEALALCAVASIVGHIERGRLAVPMRFLEFATDADCAAPWAPSENGGECSDERHETNPRMRP